MAFILFWSLRSCQRLAFDMGFSSGEAKFYLEECAYNLSLAKEAVEADREWERTQGDKVKVSPHLGMHSFARSGQCRIMIRRHIL